MRVETKPAPSPRPETHGDSRYRMPAEWEPHDAIWLQWPDRSMAGQHQMKLEVAGAIADHLGVPHLKAATTLEGGALEVNGTGSLIATESSIVNDNRNPGTTRSAIEAELERFLAVENVIWLSGAPKDVCDAFGDVTDWHVDIAARFTDRSTVLYCWTDDQNDPRYPYLVTHRRQLEQATDEAGHALQLVALPTPESAR